MLDVETLPRRAYASISYQHAASCRIRILDVGIEGVPEFEIMSLRHDLPMLCDDQ